MSQARFIVGPVQQVLKTLPDNSVDLVLTSPPFLALRSYLPADDPNKHLELGSEPTPGEFIDALLDVVEECRRVLAPHGSLCLELGDTYAGSGGAGGDYGENGLREGQPKFEGSSALSIRGDASPPVVSGKGDGRRADAGPPTPVFQGADERNAPGYRGFAGAKRFRRGSQAGAGWPLDKSLSLVPELFRIALAYGRNPLTGRETEPWRVRNVVRWVRPNPPVGALGDKFRPATSEMVVACTSRTRYFDLDVVREPHRAPDPYVNGYARRKAGAQPASMGTDAKGGPTSGANNPAGAPPLDWWAIPTEPYPGSHYATWPRDLCVKPIKSMCPPGGTVLDPFCGSGTTLAVATGQGRNAIGIDLDARNVDLVMQRVGMFLTVEHYQAEGVA